MSNLTIAKIAYSAGKGEAITLAQEANLVQGKGLEADYHSELGDGLIVVTSIPLVQWMEQSRVKGLCFKRFRYNICFSGSIDHLKSWDAFSLGQAELVISNRIKPCFALKQPCAIPNNTCKLPFEMKFAEIQKGGIIAVGDTLQSII